MTDQNTTPEQADLAAALARDDEQEAAGMHPDQRDTCWRCQGWADHAHDVTGRWMSLGEYAEQWGREVGE